MSSILRRFLFISLLLLSPVTFALNTINLKVNPEQVVHLPMTASCLTTTLSLASSSNWYAQGVLTITNNCTSQQTINNSIVSFQSNSLNLSTMWGGVNSSSEFSYKGNIASSVLIIQNDPLLIGKSLVLNFGINLTGMPFDLTSARNTLTLSQNAPSPANGELDVKVDPTGVTGVTDPASIVVTGPGLTQPYTIVNSTWNAPSLFKITGLTYGTYTITPQAVASRYNGIATPATVTLSSATPVLSTVTYQPMIATGALQVNLGTAPLTNISSSVNFTLKDNTDNQSRVVNVAWNSFVLINNLPVGHNYSVTFPQVSNGISFSDANTIANPIILQNRTTPLTVTYKAPQPIPSQSVAFTVSGLATNVTGSMTITDSFGNMFNKTNFGNGVTTQALPVNNTYAVNASAPGMFATVTPSSFTLKSGSPAPTATIAYTANPPPSANAYFFAYADTGMQSANNGLIPPKGGNMVEAFILYNPWLGKSDLWAITQGDPISQIVANTPNTFASVGGANGPFPWDYETVDKGVAEIEGLVDYYHFIGIDFDVEGAALETPSVQTWVAAAVAKLKKDKPNLILTLTVPDPVIGYTAGTVVILNKTLQANNNKMIFNWVNKMAFDMNGLGNGCTQTDTNMNNNCLVISATTAATQLATMLKIDEKTAYTYVGSTFMIPVDDQGHPLSLSLANSIATTLKNKGVNRMGYWRLQNDSNLTYGNMFTKILGLST